MIEVEPDCLKFHSERPASIKSSCIFFSMVQMLLDLFHFQQPFEKGHCLILQHQRSLNSCFQTLAYFSRQSICWAYRRLLQQLIPSIYLVCLVAYALSRLISLHVNFFCFNTICAKSYHVTVSTIYSNLLYNCSIRLQFQNDEF